jgi:hypothetical protein
MHWIYAHLIGDYLLQNDWMALGKKEKSRNCLVHVLIYMVPFLFTPLEVWQILAIGLQHYIQDRTQFVMWFMKVKGSEKFATGPCAPWSIIVTDNILHILFMALICAI